MLRHNVGTAAAIAVFSAFLCVSLGAPTCRTSGFREECAYTQTFPCSWSAAQCEFQYDFLSFECKNVPASSAASVSCSPTDSNKRYALRLMDTTSFNMWKANSYPQTCENEGCSEWVSGDLDWSGATQNNETVSAFYTTISILDYNSCLDITCDIDFAPA